MIFNSSGNKYGLITCQTAPGAVDNDDDEEEEEKTPDMYAVLLHLIFWMIFHKIILNLKMNTS
ncbi:unnamed protein product [Schistosoma margrebowiei]|uniref:Uncharacterized protein n=1 Tax=Schistosoma margrebowiei TaxID=48269 RepID=A0A183N7Y4_9TREM|nr:unnamed protein product [Schistosoma margrebowiei]